MSRIQTDIWSQLAQLGSCLDSELAKSITSTSCWSKRAAVSRAVWGGALSWTYTKLRPNTPLAPGNIWFLRIWMYRCRFFHPPLPALSPPYPPPPPPPPPPNTRFLWCGRPVVSQNFANASFRHPQHPGYFSLRIAICRQPDNSLQYLLWQILWHDPL